MRERCGIARRHDGKRGAVKAGTDTKDTLALTVPVRTPPEHPHGTAICRGGTQRLLLTRGNSGDALRFPANVLTRSPVSAIQRTEIDPPTQFPIGNPTKQ